MTRKRTDINRAVLFLYLVRNGLPPWAEGDEMCKALSYVTGWTDERAERALELSVLAGYAEKAVPA